MSAGRHLSEPETVDLVEGTASAERREHAAECAECQARADAAREGWRAAREADVPEPSPLYWGAFRGQVGRRIDAERARSRRTRVLAVLALAAALAGAAVLAPWRLAAPVGPSAGPSAAAVVLPPWSALPDAQDDAALDVLQAFAESSDVALGSECRMDECLADLTEEEGRALAKELEASLGTGRES